MLFAGIFHIQENIIVHLDNSGNIVIKYECDAWGNHAVPDARILKLAIKDMIEG